MDLGAAAIVVRTPLTELAADEADASAGRGGGEPDRASARRAGAVIARVSE
jgi:hypothetical protein